MRVGLATKQKHKTKISRSSRLPWKVCEQAERTFRLSSSGSSYLLPVCLARGMLLEVQKTGQEPLEEHLDALVDLPLPPSNLDDSGLLVHPSLE